MQVYDEDGEDRTPRQLVQRQMVSVRPPSQAALPSALPVGTRPANASILGRHHRESRMDSRVSKLSETHLLRIMAASYTSRSCSLTKDLTRNFVSSAFKAKFAATAAAHGQSLAQ